MRPKLSALIIYPDYEGKNLHIDTGDIVNIGATDVDLKFLKSTDNIMSELNKFKGFDLLVTIGDKLDLSPLSNASFEIRKRWVHLNEFDRDEIADALISTFMANIWRDREDCKLFSIFTCTFNTPKKDLDRLYQSLCKQTYKNWNWWVLDDSNNLGSAAEYLEKYHDPRITVIKNVTNHGVIGFNKHVIASACDGDYLVEVDHDDELTEDCLELLKKAFDTYEDADFVFSHALEELDGDAVFYNGDFALGQGYYSKEIVNGVEYNVPMTADVNCLTLRHIVGLPNHVRCWKREFYHRIGGHCTDLAVLDDMDLLIRTFLNGKMCKVDKILYIQHEGTANDNNGRGSTTQGNRYPEIVRTGLLLLWKYDKQIHERILELGYTDDIWDEKLGYSIVRVYKNTKFTSFNYTLKVDGRGL